jgi:chaperone required for assembly of F1-ATPase
MWRLKLDPSFSPCTSISSKWIKDLNARCETIIEKILEYFSTDNNFLNRTPVPQQLREKIDKWNCIKLKSFCTAKETVTSLKTQPTEWKRNLAMHLTRD